MTSTFGDRPSRNTRQQIREREKQEKEAYESSPSKNTRNKKPIALSVEAVYEQSKRQKRVEETLASGESISDPCDIMSAVAQTASRAMSSKDHSQSREQESLELESSKQMLQRLSQTERASSISSASDEPVEPVMERASSAPPTLDNPISANSIRPEHIDGAMAHISHIYEHGAEERNVRDLREENQNKKAHNFFFEATKLLKDLKEMKNSSEVDLESIQFYWEHISGKDMEDNYTLDNFYLRAATNYIERAARYKRQNIDIISQEIEEEAGMPQGPDIMALCPIG